MRNSEVWLQDFYDRVDGEAVGDYVKVQEQLRTLMAINNSELQQAEDLQISIEDHLEILAQIEERYQQAITPAEQTALEADWLQESNRLNEDFAEWHRLSAEARERILGGLPALQQANAALPESSELFAQEIGETISSEPLAPAVNEKLMNAVQLKRLLNEPLTAEERSQVVTLAFSCPLEAGNAVYRARSVMRTWGNYVFDDSANCEAQKEDDSKGDSKGDGDGRKNKTLDSEVIPSDDQWRIYPNPAQDRLWIAGGRVAEVESIQLFNGFWPVCTLPKQYGRCTDGSLFAL